MEGVGHALAVTKKSIEEVCHFDSGFSALHRDMRLNGEESLALQYPPVLISYAYSALFFCFRDFMGLGSLIGTLLLQAEECVLQQKSMTANVKNALKIVEAIR